MIKPSMLQVIQKKMMSSLLMKSLPTLILCVRTQWDYVYYPGNEEFQKRLCEILNLKFVTAARILPGCRTTPLSDERVPNSTFDVPVDGNCLFYALLYLINRSISQHYESRK
uniref:OTU domain-containing protein n=1 Tax=Amphimedon queenslandica TaxID=400682 RepID=A0A1X7VGZ8_AMPQE